MRVEIDNDVEEDDAPLPLDEARAQIARAEDERPARLSKDPFYMVADAMLLTLLSIAESLNQIASSREPLGG